MAQYLAFVNYRQPNGRKSQRQLRFDAVSIEDAMEYVDNVMITDDYHIKELYKLVAKSSRTIQKVEE